MKAAILGLSLLANIGLAVFLLASGRSEEIRTSTGGSEQGAGDPGTGPLVQDEVSPPSGKSTGFVTFSWLESIPAHRLAEQLRKAGLSPEVTRAIVTAQVEAPMAARNRALVQAVLDRTPYWKNLPAGDWLTPEQRAEINAMKRESAERVRELLGPAQPGGLAGVRNRIAYGSIPPAKIEALSEIEMDYFNLSRKIQGNPGAQGGGPNTREQLSLLETEKQKDIRALLSENEHDEYLFRRSPSSINLRGSIRGFAPTEAEFRAMFPIQQAFDLKYPMGTGGTGIRERMGAEPQLREELKGVLSPERRAEFERVTKK